MREVASHAVRAWQRETGTREWFRWFTGQRRVVDPDHDIYVRVAGEQYADGRIDRWVSVEEAIRPLTVAQAKALARALIAAAEEITEAARYDNIVRSVQP
jgi:hypothetical protein